MPRRRVLLDTSRHEEAFYVAPLTDALLQDAITLYGERGDKNWGITDCVSFVLMRQEEVSEALTADIHFRQAGFHPLLLD